jgi:hypothetical protein
VVLRQCEQLQLALGTWLEQQQQQDSMLARAAIVGLRRVVQQQQQQQMTGSALGLQLCEQLERLAAGDSSNGSSSSSNVSSS